MVAAAPLDEGAHAALVRLLGRLRRYPEAEAHYAHARELLRREVAAPAGGPLDEAIRGVRRDTRSAAAHASVAAAVPAVERVAIDAAVPLVGRDDECRALDALLSAEQRQLLLLVGEPGIGKTRLLDHFEHAAVAAGYRVVRGRCYEAEMVRPYGLWLDALRGAATGQMTAQLRAAAAPLLAASGDEIATAGSRARLFDAAAALIEALCATCPVAFALDDLQWLDEGSAALLHFLARSLDARVVFVGAARAGEIDDNPWTKRLLQSLARERRVQRQELAPLAACDVAALLARAGGADGRRRGDARKRG